ncbi:hypothetical protein D3C71_2080310 [compost metagenome]
MRYKAIHTYMIDFCPFRTNLKELMKEISLFNEGFPTVDVLVLVSVLHISHADRRVAVNSAELLNRRLRDAAWFKHKDGVQ